jgi:NitT/TauT family transport system substrate-binding protein
MNTFTRKLGIPVLLAAILTVSACGGAGALPKADGKGDGPTAAVSAPAQKKQLKIGYLNVMDDAQTMLAKDAGLYDKHGLDVDLKMFDSGTTMIQAIVGGQLDAGVLGFTNAVTWAAKGADIKVVGGAQMGYHSLLVKKGSGIKTLADLKGKKVASQQKGSTADIVWNGVVLPQAGLSRTDVNMVYVTPAAAIQSLAAGQVDAAFVFEPYESIAKATSDVDTIYEIGKVWPFPCMVVITSGKQLNADRAAIEAMLDAQKQAMEMMQQQPQEAARALVKRFVQDESLTGPQGTFPAVAIVQKAIESQMFHWSLNQDEVKRMQELADIMVQQGAMEKPVKVEQVLDLAWQQKQTAHAGH